MVTHTHCNAYTATYTTYKTIKYTHIIYNVTFRVRAD